MAAVSRIFPFAGTCNNYPWGRKGGKSLAARMAASSPQEDFKIDEDQYYSELWFGDYPDFPGHLKDGTELSDVLRKNNTALLGEHSIGKFGDQLPFLPKILSIAKALPLQVHPNKDLAAKLQKQNPDQFSDANHKPEIAIALSHFELFAGWKELDEIALLFTTPALQGLIPPSTAAWTDETLREVVRALLKADSKTIRKIQDEITDLLESDFKKNGSQEAIYLLRVFRQLQEQYSDLDPGTLVAVLCMNFLMLEAGDAIFIPADGVHCYLSGDIFECMARSDNMLAGGLCPSADRDHADLFCDTLRFGPSTRPRGIHLPAQTIRDARSGLVDHNVAKFSPPIGEFDVLRVNVAPGKEEALQAAQGPTVAIVLRGDGKVVGDGKEVPLKQGQVFFVAANTAATVQADTDMELYVTIGG